MKKVYDIDNRRYHKKMRPSAQRKTDCSKNGDDAEENVKHMQEIHTLLRKRRKLVRIKVGNCVIETTNPDKWKKYVEERKEQERLFGRRL